MRLVLYGKDEASNQKQSQAITCPTNMNMGSINCWFLYKIEIECSCTIFQLLK